MCKHVRRILIFRLGRGTANLSATYETWLAHTVASNNKAFLCCSYRPFHFQIQFLNAAKRNLNVIVPPPTYDEKVD